MKKDEANIEPDQVDDQTWYYLEPDGVCYVQEEYKGEQYSRTHMVTIPWSVLERIMQAHRTGG